LFLYFFAFNELSQFREFVVDTLIRMHQVLVEEPNAFGVFQDFKSQLPNRIGSCRLTHFAVRGRMSF
jgi:hypothetical protein